MKQKMKSIAIQRGNYLLRKYGVSPKVLGYVKNEGEVRFKALTQIGEMRGSRILDVGCGFGDLLPYLNKLNREPLSYLGVDINQSFIDIARERHAQEENASFLCKDIQESPVKREYDWVLSCGVFNYKSYVDRQFIVRMLTRMYNISSKGVAVDFISSYVNFRDRKIFYTDPGWVFAITKSLSKRVVLRHDYMPYEFCVYIYKNQPVSYRNCFEEEDGL